MLMLTEREITDDDVFLRGIIKWKYHISSNIPLNRGIVNMHFHTVIGLAEPYV